MDKTEAAKKIKALHPAVWWGAGYLACLLVVLGLSYYWRAFYYFNRVSTAALLLGVGAVFSALYLALFLLWRFVKSFDVRCMCVIILAGLLFVFAAPPLQVPDESLYFLRAYSISTGHLDFDHARGYPDDVDALMSCFSGSWGKEHNYYLIKEDAHIAERFATYFSLTRAQTPLTDVKEPNTFMVLPYLPQAAGMLAARVLGFGALGALYGGRIANLLVYAAICYFALKNCKRYKPVFLAVMLLPLGLFLAGSLNYDAMLLAATYFVASYFCKDEITDRDMLWFALAFSVLCAVKVNNILWLAMPLVLPKAVWKCRFPKWQAALMALSAALALMFVFEQYAVLFSHNYPPPERMLEGVNQMEQLRFMLAYPARFCATALGTLYENVLFFFKMGEFGHLDANIPMVSALSASVLLLSATFSAHPKSRLSGKSALGLFAFAGAYIAAVLAGLYITYTPVGMIRIIGLQARYFIPAFLILLVLLSALFSRVLEPADKSQKHACAYMLCISGAFSVLSGILLFQHYYIGPVLGQ